MHFERQLHQRRIKISESLLEGLKGEVSKKGLPDFARDKRVPYTIIYNLLRQKTKSLSAKDYRRIFGEDPPYETTQRVDGEFFRGMVRLWLFLHDDVTGKDLYGALHPAKHYKKVDYRIFSGKVQTVTWAIEKAMEKKFSDQGLSRPEIEVWVAEMSEAENRERIPYEEAKPVLDFLRWALEISPGRILNQAISRFESGELKTIPKEYYEVALGLKARTERALRSGSRRELEFAREQIAGKREGFTLFSELEEQLEFLRTYGKKGPKKYLGRSIGHYERSKLLRVASWRARRIKKDCEALIREKPEIPIMALPQSFLKRRIARLSGTMKALLVRNLIEDESNPYEKLVLKPFYRSSGEFLTEALISMDRAPMILGMSRKAFDLMVARHGDLFRKVAKYEDRWCLPVAYVEALEKREGFVHVREKYELLARKEVYVSPPKREGGPVSPSETNPTHSPVARKDNIGDEPTHCLTNRGSTFLLLCSPEQGSLVLAA